MAFCFHMISYNHILQFSKNIISVLILLFDDILLSCLNWLFSI